MMSLNSGTPGMMMQKPKNPAYMILPRYAHINNKYQFYYILNEHSY